MTDEFALHQKVTDGHAADHDLRQYEQAFRALKAQYVEAWEATGYKDAEGRERLWQAVQIVGKVESHLKQVAANGRVAAKEIERLKGKRPIF